MVELNLMAACLNCFSQEEKGLGGIPLRERQLFGKNSQNRRAIVHMDFSSFEVLIPFLPDTVDFDFMPEVAKNPLIFCYMSLHKKVCKFKFYLCVYTPGTENMHVSFINKQQCCNSLY